MEAPRICLMRSSVALGVIGPAGSDAIKQMLDAAGTAQPQGWTGLVGIAVLLLAATGFVGSLQDALDKIWDAPPRPDCVWSFIKNKLFSFSFVLDSPKELSRRPSRSRTSHYRC
jgi:uncharacterized BrkB/YihY/UPF0761 family membrane protein